MIKIKTGIGKRLGLGILVLLGAHSVAARADEYRRDDRRVVDHRMDDRRRIDDHRREEGRLAEERRFQPVPVYAPAPVVVAPPPPSPGINLVIPLSFH